MSLLDLDYHLIGSPESMAPSTSNRSTARIIGVGASAPERENRKKMWPSKLIAYRLLPSTFDRFRSRYNEVAREAVEASKVAADDPAKQFAISFFDNKLTSLLPLKVTYFVG